MTNSVWQRAERRTRRLPQNPNLEQLKNQAKDVLKAHKSGDESCCDVLRFLAQFADKSRQQILAARITLQEAQHALALSYDWGDWAMMVETVLMCEGKSSDNPDGISEFIRKMLMEAIKTGASHVYFEPYQLNYRVRYKIDGELYTVATPPVELGPRLAEQIKRNASMDLDENKQPAEAVYELPLSRTKSIHIKVETFPIASGEKINLSFRDPAAVTLGFEKLGLEPPQIKALRSALGNRRGMVLVTGPRANGKTVTIYTAINELNTPALEIASVEAPVEIHLEGVNQYSVQRDDIPGYEEGIRISLLQEPDVLMISELKTSVSAALAVEASNAGQFVIATLQSDSARDALTRLRALAIPADDLARAVKLIVNQHLLRRLCTHCRIEVDDAKPELLAAGYPESALEPGFKLFAPAGCDKCHSGYKGRIGVFELLEVTDNLSRLIAGDGDAADIEAAQLATGNLRQSALLHLRSGITSLEEVRRLMD